MEGNKYTKAEIVDSIYNKTSMNRKDILKMLDLVFDEIKIGLRQRRIIELRGFGTFEIRIRKGRQKARNPKTGEAVSSDSHGVVAFRAGRDLKQDVWNINKPDEEN